MCTFPPAFLFTTNPPLPSALSLSVSDETAGGREPKAGHEAEDPQGAGGLRGEGRRHRESPGERAGAADRELAPRPRKAQGRAAQKPGGGG